MFKWIVFAYLILNPLAFAFGVDTRLIQEFFFQMSSLVLIMCGFLKSNPIKFSKFNIPFVLLLAWFLFIFIFFKFGWSTFLNFFISALVYTTVVRTIDKKDIRFILRGIACISLFAVAWLALQYLGYDPRGYVIANTTNQVPHCSFFNLEGSMGMYFALSIPILLMFSWVSLLMFVPLIFSWSTAAYIGGVVGTFIYFWFRKRKLFWITLLPIVIAAFYFIFFVDMPMGMFKTRGPLWKLVIHDINKSPLVGYGLDSFRNNPNENSYKYFQNPLTNETIRLTTMNKMPMIEEKYAPELKRLKENNLTLNFWDNAHNTFIHYAYETGLMFLLLSGICIYNILLRFKRSRRSPETTAIFASLMTFFIFSMTQFPFNLARIGHAFPVLLGLFFISTEEDAS